MAHFSASTIHTLVSRMPRRCPQRTFAFTLVATILILGGGGCGGCGGGAEPPPEADAPPPPMAMKDVQFGSGMVAVQNRIGILKKVMGEGPLSVYRRNPADDTAETQVQTPVVYYDFYFHREELVEVQIFYNTGELRATIGRDTFFRTIESRYETKEDFNAPEGRRWVNAERGIEVVWQEDFGQNAGKLTVTWLDKKTDLEHARERLRRQREQESQGGDEGGGVDIGI